MTVTISNGFARIADIAPDEIVVFTEDSDWAFMGGDFKRATTAVIAEDERLQPPLPFADDARVEAQ